MKLITKSNEIPAEHKELLENSAAEIRSLIRTTLESVVRIGQILKKVKTTLPYGAWQSWVDTEFPEDIKHDSADNWINLAELYEEYQEKYKDGFKRLSLGALYKLSRSNIDDNVKDTVLRLASEGESLSRSEIDSIVKVYRMAKLVEAGVDPTIATELNAAEFAENAKELNRFSKLSKNKQAAVASLIGAGVASSPKEAIQQLSISSHTTTKLDPVEVHYTQINESNFDSLQSIPSNCVNLAIIEAPLKFSYVEAELNRLCIELERVLAAGGYVIITVGHKAVMYAGDRMSPLNPLHILCLRRQPGNSRSIVGTNILSASVFAILAYKSPYRAPQKMLVDLQTIDEQLLENMDTVVNGLEAGFTKFMTSLVQRGDVVLHMICSENHFGMRSALKDSAIELNAKSFYTVG